MAMRIMHDASAALTLGELNKNANNLQKDLKKVASGMRINSAADDASGYAIGERMAVRLRALNQDIINTQTGSDLIRVAESGVQSVIEELRTLKELALNSINDHNSELDRATLQKEFEQRTANIDNIANETNYNGRILLNGDYRRKFLGTSTIPAGRNVLSTNTVSSTVTSAPVTSSSTKNSVQTSKPVTKTTRSTTTTTSATKPTTGTTEGTPTSTTTTSHSTSVVGPTPSVTSNTVTADVQTTDNGDGTFTEVKTDVTTRATTNTTVTTDTETTTTVTTKVSTIVSAKEVQSGSSQNNVLNALSTRRLNSAASPAVRMDTIQGLFPTGNTTLLNNGGEYSWFRGKTGYETPCTDYYNAKYSVILDFSNATLSNGNALSYPLSLHNQGFTAICQYGTGRQCHEFVSISFDAGKASGTAELLTHPTNYVGGEYQHHVYIVGIAGANSADDVIKAIYDGIKSLTSSFTENEWRQAKAHNPGDVAQLSFDWDEHDIKITKRADGKYELSSTGYALWIYEAVLGDDTFRPIPSPVDPPSPSVFEITTETITTTETTITTKETKTTKYETVTNTITDTTTIVYEPKEENIEHYNAPLIIHTGTKANQHLRVYIEDMRPEALGIDKVKVDPQEAAIESLAIIDGAIDYAIEQATHLGAYISRLGHTENTLTADSENTQASESTIRDADMALEMLHYTKDNILAQTAQAMLAQANQNASSVLSLLQ